MNKHLTLATLLCAAAALSIAQTTPDPQSTGPQSANKMAAPQADSASSTQRPATPAIPATLAKSVDSKKAKAGDVIEAKTSVTLSGASGTQIPAGAKIVGHITDAKAKSKGDPQSTLTFAFDKIVLKDGKEVPFRAVAQAIGPELSMSGSPLSDADAPQQPASGTRAAGPTAGAGPGSAGDAASPSGTPQDMENQSSNSARLPQNAIGVVGMKGLTLSSQADASVISSDSKSVKLDEGTQLLLRFVRQ